MGKGVQLAVATVSVFAALAWLLSQSGGEGTFRYYRNVSDYAESADAGSDPSQSERIHGFVVDASIERDLGRGHVDFAIRDDGDASELRVRLLGLDIPDLFTDGAEVVVEGRPGPDRFLADRVLAKCPSKYEADLGSKGPEA